jgi:type 1 glutamine amidotransferase
MIVKRVLSIAAAFVSAGTALAAEPAAPVKKVLVFSRIEGFNHKASVAACKEKMAEEAKKCAFAVDFIDDYAALEIGNLVQYDALVLNNTTHLKTKDHPSVAPSICSYVRWGGGLCAIHAGADNFYNAPDCAHLVGGRFDGHPWRSNGTWAFKVEDRESPLTAPFKGFADGKFKRGDEIYQQASPFYDRAKLHILVSLDLSDPATAGVKGMVTRLVGLPDETFKYPTIKARFMFAGRYFPCPESYVTLWVDGIVPSMVAPPETGVNLLRPVWFSGYIAKNLWSPLPPFQVSLVPP